jgi:hydrogenase expression/formation protein HypE
MYTHITLEHGYGGTKSQELLEKLIHPIFHSTNHLPFFTDSAIVNIPGQTLAFTTDSFVVSPIFFPGGDIGKLSVCGTINDLCVCGAKPLYLSCALILEDGFSMDELQKILVSMQKVAIQENVKIITGDTKVVEKGSVDKIFINTSGIGVIYPDRMSSLSSIQEGDSVIVTGTIGDHGMTIFTRRNNVNILSSIQSDCNSIQSLVEIILDECNEVRVMRDPTRGGLATTLNEFTSNQSYSIELQESSIPVNRPVKGLCEILGMDPLYLANEGKLVCILPQQFSTKVLEKLKKHPLGKDSAIIGHVTKKYRSMVYLKTVVGGERIIDSLSGESLPRIC